jgi:hypothetical protein
MRRGTKCRAKRVLVEGEKKQDKLAARGGGEELAVGEGWRRRRRLKESTGRRISAKTIELWRRNRREHVRDGGGHAVKKLSRNALWKIDARGFFRVRDTRRA